MTTMIEHRSHAVRHAQETPLSFDSRVDSKPQGKRAQGSTRNAPTNHQSPTPQEASSGQVQDAIMSVVICDSVVHFSMSGPHECDFQHKLDSSWTNTIGIGWSQSFPHHVNAVDHSAIKILEQRLVLSLNSVDFRTVVTNCHDGVGVHHFTGTTQVSMVLSPPLHRF